MKKLNELLDGNFDMEKYIILNQAKFTKIKHDFNQGIISYDESTTNIAKINSSILDFIHDLEDGVFQIKNDIKIVFEKFHLPYTGGVLIGQKLLSVSYDFGFQIKNIGNVKEDNFKIEAVLPWLALKNSYGNSGKNLHQLKKENKLVTFSIPSKEIIFPNESVVIMSGYNIILDYWSSRDLNEFQIRIRIFQMNGIHETISNIFEYVEFENKELNAESFYER